MRIALVVHQLPPRNLGGVEVYTWTLAQQLVALGHEVAIFCPTADPADAGRTQVNGVALVRPLRPDPRGLPAPLAFWRTFRHLGTEGAFRAFLRAWLPDIVHVQHTQWVSARALRLCGDIPTVLTLHDYWYICPNGQLVQSGGAPCFGASARGCAACLLGAQGLPAGQVRVLAPFLAPALAWRNRYVRASALRAGLLLTPSPQARDIYVAAGFPAERLRAFDNGLDPARFKELPPRPAAPRDHAVFGYIGALAWQKGVHVLIEAFRALAPQHELRIYGPENAFPGYVQRLRELAATHPGVHLLGPVPPEQVGAALADLDYLIVPSLWPETFGMVTQEANYVGVPVVASRIGALQRIRHGVDGLLFPPGDSGALSQILQCLAMHPELRANLVANLRPGPTIAEQAGGLVTLYQGLLAAS
ncbi:MAG: glycosyltransferase family 4 protein [Anaerolineales bacterium]